ncbi:MAG: tRNA (adenosine(37)-N6)-threonylcarbamoyltransferase complex dimerization subunit type 1 TsaB [Oricola sp.]
MTTLALDTSMAACSAAILRPDAPHAVQRFERMEKGHAEALFEMIEAVLEDSGCGFDDLEKIAVTVGPGSFTGVRAGVAAARGLALAAKLPLVGASSLEVMARGCVRQTGEGDRQDGFIVVHDARRGEVYAQRFDADGRPTAQPELRLLTELAAELAPASCLVVGSAAAAIAGEAERSGRQLRIALPELLPEAGDLAVICASKPPQAYPPAPLYLRAADAKPQIGKSLARAE